MLWFADHAFSGTPQVLDHVVELTQDMGLGIIVDDQAKKILDKGAEIKDTKPKKEDIISD
jgi:LETM1 and EF-hand domain-containing protein 1